MNNYFKTNSMALASILEGKGYPCLQIQFDELGINQFIFEKSKEVDEIAYTYKKSPEYKTITDFIIIKKRATANRSAWENMKNL